MQNDALIEQGVEVLRRLTVSNKLSLGDASFIAGWVNDARTELRRAATSPASDLVDRLEAAIKLAENMGVRGKHSSNIYNLAAEAAQALRYQSTGVTGEMLRRWLDLVDIVITGPEPDEALGFLRDAITAALSAQERG